MTNSELAKLMLLSSTTIDTLCRHRWLFKRRGAIQVEVAHNVHYVLVKVRWGCTEHRDHAPVGVDDECHQPADVDPWLGLSLPVNSGKLSLKNFPFVENTADGVYRNRRDASPSGFAVRGMRSEALISDACEQPERPSHGSPAKIDPADQRLWCRKLKFFHLVVRNLVRSGDGIPVPLRIRETAIR
jgi:hypothetical protein